MALSPALTAPAAYLLALSSRWLPVHRATDPVACAAVFAQRYAVYVDELGHTAHPYADHEHRRIVDPRDEAEGAVNWYVGRPDQILASVRTHRFEPGRVPDEVARLYSLSRFSDLSRRLTCEVGYFMTHRTRRATATALGLAAQGLARTIAWGVEMYFGDCPAALLPRYAKMGWRPYGGATIDFSAGFLVPVAFVPGDLEHLRRVRSAAVPILAPVAHRGALPTRDLDALLEPLRNCGVELDEVDVLATLERAADRCASLQQAPASVRRTFAELGYTLEVGEGVHVAKQGARDRTVTLLLDGEVRITRDAEERARVGAHAPVPELGLRPEGAPRCSTVTTTAPSRLLIIPRRAIIELHRREPLRALAVYEALAAGLTGGRRR